MSKKQSSIPWLKCLLSNLFHYTIKDYIQIVPHLRLERTIARNNQSKHDVTFQQRAEAFFDPFLKVVDASRNDEARDAIIAMDSSGIFYLWFTLPLKMT